MSARPLPIEVFLSYAETDESLCLKMERHLSLLKREGLITTWHKGQIGVGTDKDEEVHRHLAKASVIVLLLSADFVASDSCYSVEMSRAIERHRAREAYVIPVVLRPMDSWQSTPFGKLPALPSNGVPVTGWSDAHAAFADVARGVRAVLRDGKLPKASLSPAPFPPIWNIPHLDSAFFTGRDELLQRLANAFAAGQAVGHTSPQVLSGPGGIGKTQIALEYAYLHRNEYQAVLWTRASTRESLISDYTSIAQLLNLPQKDAQDQQVIVQAVKTWLQTQDSWLLILDDADDLALVSEFIPTVLGGHLLLTTQAQSMDRAAKPIEVGRMDQDVGALFLLRRAGLVAEDASLDTALSSDEALARSICQELGGLPLALEQAGAYIEEVECSLTDYLRLYRMRRTALLSAYAGLLDDHREPVATTWSISFKSVEEKNPTSTDLLRLCAFAHPDAIPEEMIAKGAEHLGPHLREIIHNPLALNTAIETLAAYSLVRRHVRNKTFTIHRLAQVVFRDTMAEEMRRQWAERMAQVINEVFPPASFPTWAQCERYLPHALVGAELVEQEHISNREAARFLNMAGGYLHNRARYLEAEPLYRKALSIREELLGAEHHDTVESRNNLIRLYKTQGMYAEAELVYQRVLEIRERQLGADHPDTAESLNNLALLYKIQRKYAEAEPVYQRVLEIRERQLGTDHPDTVASRNNLAALYRMQGEYAKAELLHEPVPVASASPMKRLSIIIISIIVALFCLLFIIYVSFSTLNSQVSSTALSLIEILAFCVVIAGIGVLAHLREPDTTYGNAHFATAQEIQQGGFIAGPRSLIIGEAERLVVGIPPRKQNEHVLLIAKAGAGKRTGIIIPALLSETGERGILINDRNGELHDKTAGALSRHMPALLFSPAQPAESIHYNPLSHIQSQEDAEDLAQCWVDNTSLSQEPSFNDIARLLITAVTLHITDTEPGAPFSLIADLLSSATFDQIRTILTKSPSAWARERGNAFINSRGADAQLAGSILSSVATRFQILKTPAVHAITSTHSNAQQNINFERLAQTPEALFLSVPVSDTRGLRPLTSLLVMQMMNYLRKQSDGKPFVLYMNELANIGNIPHYVENISRVRDQGIALIQSIQNFSQLKATYGDEDAQTIIENSTTKIFYPGMGKLECEYVSQLLGTTTVKLKSKSTTTNSGEETYTETVAPRLLMSPEEIRQLPRGRLIVVSGDLPPMLVTNTPYYQQP
jgi:type IV secretory pathway TraG/TraD family ATPase VirD4/tetratricopeptide (TPR) repeat protein